MKLRIIYVVFISIIINITTVFAQVQIGSTNYTTLKAAFDAINVSLLYGTSCKC